MPLRWLLTTAFLALTASVLSGASASLAWAGDRFQPIVSEELAMKSESQAPGAPAIILLRQVDRDDSNMHEDNYLRIKILTEEGRKYGDVEIPFFKDREDIKNLHARTIRPDGSIVTFEGKPFEKSIIKARGVKYLAKTFTFPDVQVGSVLEYYYTVAFTDQLLYDSRWILSQDLFTKQAVFSLRPYGGLSLRWSWQGLPPDNQPQMGSDHMVHLVARDIPAFQAEDFMPPEDEMKAHVNFIYEDSSEKDIEKYWKEFGKKRNEALESFIGKHKAMESAVSQIVSPNDPPDTKLRKIYTRVQNFRNTSFEVQKTDQEIKRQKEKSSENVEEIWKRGYADGQSLTWLFLALSRAAGFEAYGCWVSPRNDYFFHPGTVEGYKLNANVVLVKVSGKDMYFDPGGKFVPFGLLDWSETGVAGRKLDKDGGSWIQTTLPTSSQSRVQHEAHFKLDDTGELEGTVKVTYTGLEAAYHRTEERAADDVQRKKYIEDDLRTRVPATIEVELKNKPDWNSAEAPLVAEFDVKVPGWVAGAGKRALFPVGLFSASEKGLFDRERRVHPIYMSYPNEQVDDVAVQLPLGWSVSSVPKPFKQDGHVVVYELSIADGKSEVHISRRLSTDITLLEQKYYTALRNFYQGVRTQDEGQIVLQSTTATASN
jgi:hypothetical protein